ncbi:MAG: terpene cyclase/mutase family protein [Pirellulales bacterium]|nr:terpene cyclase/mutase family protein [Pirellulales bacterium]
MPTASSETSTDQGVRDEGDRVHPFQTGVVGCACPDCGAPMSVRLWLMTADCWQCSRSIDLSFAKIQELSEPARPAVPGRDLQAEPKMLGLAQVLPRAEPISEPPLTHAIPHPAGGPLSASGREPSWTAPPPRHGFPMDWPLIAPAVAHAQVPATVSRDFPLLSNENLQDLLAWLISAIVHLLLMILLGLVAPRLAEDRPPRIVLSVDVNPIRREGELPNQHATIMLPDFDLPVSERPTDATERDALRMADQDARQIRLAPDAAVRTLPDLMRIRADLGADDPFRRMHAARDPRLRAIVIRREGGTTMTEAAVARALRWLARHQDADGSWSLHAFHQTPECQGRCSGRGTIRSKSGGTGLALQPFLGAGQTHRTGIYRDVVSHGLQYLLGIQKPDGDLRDTSHENCGMYIHAQATIVLCDAYKLTGDETLRDPAQKAIDFICSAQHDQGGWRYNPGQLGDTSVIGWQLMALHSARACHFDIPEDVFRKASCYLDLAQTDDDGALYAYQPGGRPTPAMTAEGLLCRMYLGWKQRDPGLQLGVFLLAEEYLPRRDESNVYYWYYATQVMHHWGGRPWEEWNRRMRDVLVSTQKISDHEAGSWDPVTPHGRQGGRLYMTALACCTLEVYYRHAPLFRKIDLE